MNAHETIAVLTGYGFFLATAALLTVYAVWAHHGYRSVRPKKRKEKRRG